MTMIEAAPSPTQKPKSARSVTIDGNEACAYVAYRVNEVCSIFPITPATPMAELADQWASEKKPNIWGQIPEVIELQSELGAAGTLHGSLMAGALATSFTASQGLLLMMPNMLKIAAELTPCVIHVAARALATHALSIFGDHQDIMAVRPSGFAQLVSSSVQEAHDFALISQAASLESRLPFIHAHDGFRTSHEVSKITLLEDEQMRAMIDEELVLAHRNRAMSPDRPDVRGTVQNPDVFFQSREAVSPFYARCADIVQNTMDRFAEVTGRQYRLFEYYGHPEAERLIVMMGSGSEAARETVEFMAARGERVGLLRVHLFRPFDIGRLLEQIPSTVQSVAVLDRTKEPGAPGEPLYVDVITAFAEQRPRSMPLVIGGRYGLGSKEFNAGMVKGVLDELTQKEPKNHFTIGILDDVSDSSLPFDPDFSVESEKVHRAIFYGLGADGTVGANKNTIKIIGEDPDLYAQGYFVYDSKKSGSQTVSHLRFGPEPIRSTYLIRSAQFIGCHLFGFVDRMDVLEYAADRATLLLNSPYGPSSVWDRLPESMQAKIIEKRIRLFVIDASRVAKETGLGGRTNTVLQTCFFAISGVLPKEEAIDKIKKSIRSTYGKKGEEVVQKNFEAVDTTLAELHEVQIPNEITSKRTLLRVVPNEAPPFVQGVTAQMMAGRGDDLPVSAMPISGIFPSGTAKWEKRNIADNVPVWDSEICIQCGNCSLVCPHGCIRAKLFNEAALEHGPEGFKSMPIDARGFPETRFTLQVYMEDCTGCTLCVDACPVRSKEQAGRRAINMVPKEGIEEENRPHLKFFESLEVNDRASVDFGTVRGAQFLEPLFEFSGACTGCGETPYLKLASQLFGDRMMVANATGCSSVFGGCLPTTPWGVNHEGRGPAWANSLFEDNAEFGLGMRITADRQMQEAQSSLVQLSSELGEEFVTHLIHAPQKLESDIRKQRLRVAKLTELLRELIAARDTSDRKRLTAKRLLSVAGALVRRSVWIIGGDGWAYDIGSGGVDHVLASGRDVNILVLDNEVYANTGGQSSKATPLGAVAKFANAGKESAKKDLALQAIAYGNVYVARVALGANPQQTLTAFREAEAYPGTSLVIAYSHCIAHGIDMEKGLEQQSLAVHSGYWPLVRFNPELREVGENPFLLDSGRPGADFKDYMDNELRYRMLRHTNSHEADRIYKAAEDYVKSHWAMYEKLAE
jgi:pyruvate-ferredoxin/flavodoxin oxidoreductase